MKLFRSVLPAAMAFCCSLPASANVLRMNLKAALDNHLIEVSATGTGQVYYGKALTLKVKNKSGSSLLIKNDQGLIFRPADTAYQDLVLAGEETLSVPPFKEATLQVQTFCAKSAASAPAANLAYSFYKTGDNQLVQVLQYLKRNYLFDALGQNAVWVVTDHHDLGSAYDPGRDMASQKLIAHLAAVTGRPLPEYYRHYRLNTSGSGPVFQPRNLKIIAQFEQKLEAPKKLTLAVYDQQGKVIQPVFENRVFGKAGHRFGVEFEATNVAAGTYYIRLKEGETVLQEKRVSVE